MDPSAFLSQEQPVKSPKELIEKADQLLSDEIQKEIPSEKVPEKPQEIAIEPTEIPVQPEAPTFNQSPKAVREYQVFENFEDPEFYNDKANFDKIIEDLNKQDKFLGFSAGSQKSMLDVVS